MPALPAETSDQIVDDLDRPVRLHVLAFLDEGEDVTVGRADTDSYCVLPADGAALLHELTGGATPRQAAQWYLDTYHEPVDVLEFLAAMDELGFVAAPDEPVSAGRQVSWQRLGRLAFSPIAWACYAGLLIAAALVMARHPDLQPRPHNLFFTDLATVVLLVTVFGQLPFVLIHEAFHALAGRRLGVRSQLRIARRLYFLVAETNLDGLVLVPRRKRYLPILAGMLADLIVFAGLSLTAAALRQPGGSQPLIGRLCLALALLTMLRLIWQFYFFLQTDLYQLVVTMLGCVDLQKTTNRLIANRLLRLVGQPQRASDESLWHPRDRAVARWYCWLLLAGYLFSAGSFVVAILPLLRRLFSGAIDGLTSGHGMRWGELADSATFLLLTIVQLGIVTFIVLRERRLRRTTAAVHVIG
ncbi:MAG: hypothetical protein ABI140_04280 [Jatrophihabitantaceae bacterium]